MAKASTNLGNTWPPGPCRKISASGVMALGLGFTSMMGLRARRAYQGSEAAGSTRPEVPTTSMASHKLLSVKARSTASDGSTSPNQTTSGRSIALQRGHCGGIPA